MGLKCIVINQKSEWDIREDGENCWNYKRNGCRGVVAAADSQQSSFPTGTIVGHVHLKVADLAQTEAFYTQSRRTELKK